MSSGATYHKPVDVMTDEGWRTFDSIKEAADFLGVPHCRLSRAIFHDDPTCGGRMIRRHQEGGAA